MIVADQDISFTAMREKLHELLRIVQQDPAVEDVHGFTGGGTLNVASACGAVEAARRDEKSPPTK